MALVVTSNNRTKIIFQGSVKARQAKQKSIIGKAIACAIVVFLVLQIVLPIAANYSL